MIDIDHRGAEEDHRGAEEGRAAEEDHRGEEDHQAAGRDRCDEFRKAKYLGQCLSSIFVFFRVHVCKDAHDLLNCIRRCK